jgi:hypothetical protein
MPSVSQVRFARMTLPPAGNAPVHTKRAHAVATSLQPHGWQTTVVLVNMGKAMAAFEQTILQVPSRFDRYVDDRHAPSHAPHRRRHHTPILEYSCASPSFAHAGERKEVDDLKLTRTAPQRWYEVGLPIQIRIRIRLQ